MSHNDRKVNQAVKRNLAPDSASVHEVKKIVHESRTQDRAASATESSSRDRREYERDEIILSRRQKQIDFGKNTLAYDKYLHALPKDKRTKDDPKTPLKHLKMNRRAWDGLIRNWKLKLHKWEAENSANDPAE